MKAFFQTIFLLLFFSLKGLGQNTNMLSNPSFEDTPKAGEAPEGWYNCGPATETPPDVQPGAFGVVTSPHNGNTYLGLVVRDNETWEAVGQELQKSLQKDSTYELRLFLARSEIYLSNSKLTGQEANYVTPVVLQVWGGYSYCDKEELLAVSPLITHTQWKEYVLNLKPSEGNKYNYITLEAYYKTPVIFAYNGNLLLDNCSLAMKKTLKSETRF